MGIHLEYKINIPVIHQRFNDRVNGVHEFIFGVGIIAVDIRKGSPTYGKHVAVELTEDNHRQFFIPKGFAHGFAVLSETAVFQYKCDNFYHPEADGGISILDDTLGIDWKIPTEHANLSEKDTKHAMLKDFDSPFDINIDLYK